MMKQSQLVLAKSILKFSEPSKYERAEAQFNELVNILEVVGVKVHVYQDDMAQEHALLSRWMMTFPDGQVCLFPLKDTDPKELPDEEVFEFLEDQGLDVGEVTDFSSAREEGLYLNGRSSVMPDSQSGKAYCAVSQDSDEDIFIEFCEEFHLFPVIFSMADKALATDSVIHVNEDFAFVFLDGISDKSVKKDLLRALSEDGKDIVNLCEEQLPSLAANMLYLKNEKGEKFLLVNEAVQGMLSESQLDIVRKYAQIVPVKVDKIINGKGFTLTDMILDVVLPLE